MCVGVCGACGGLRVKTRATKVKKKKCLKKRKKEKYVQKLDNAMTVVGLVGYGTGEPVVGFCVPRHGA
jgi:hypothetical protein